MRTIHRIDTEGHRRQRWVPLVVFGLSILVTGLVWLVAESFVRNRDDLRVQSEVRRIENALVDRMASQADLLQTLSAEFQSRGVMTREEFAKFSSAVDIERTYPGMRALAFAVAFRPATMDKAQKIARKVSGRPMVVRPPNQKEGWAVLLVEPKAIQKRNVYGLNIGIEAIRRATMEAARDHGEVGLSNRVPLAILPQSEPAPIGFILYCPVYSQNGLKTVSERRAHHLGFVFSPFSGEDLFREVFRQRRGLQMYVEIFDGPTHDPSKLLYRNVPAPLLGGGPIATHTVMVANRSWSIRYFPRPEFVAESGVPLARWIPFAGLLLAIILAALSQSQVRAGEALFNATRELQDRENQQRMLAQLSAQLGSSMDIEENLRRVTSMVVPTFADWCVVELADWEGKLHRLAIGHVDPEKVRWGLEFSEKYPPDPNSNAGSANVFRTGKSELHAVVPAELVMSTARNEEHGRQLARIGVSSAVIVPMIAREQKFGTITFLWAESKRHFNEEDLAFAEAVGSRAATAIESSRLFAEREREVKVRREAEARVRETNENLEQLVQERTRDLTIANNELEAFCYSVSHDLRAPLRSVDGFSKALLEDYGQLLEDEGKGYVERVRLAARRMDELIAALLALSRLTRVELKRQPVDISEIAQEVAEELLSGENVRAKISIEPGLHTDADPRMVRVVLANLMTNAIKFSGSVELPSVQVGQEEGAFFVRDNGVGFNPDYAGKLFQPFERLHPAGEFPGTGIGLATVHRIATRHGGNVWAKGQEGSGATFYFTFG